MKKYIDKTYLRGVEDHDFKVIRDYELDCYISFKRINKIDESYFIERDGVDICLLADGYYIIEYIPIGENYTVRTFLDKDEEVIEWYIDITGENGINQDGIPYYDDLYLDIIIFKGKVELLDEEELKEAFDEGKITEDSFNLAYKVANELKRQIEVKENTFVNRGNKDLKKVLEL
ncbi:MAG: hypothetical protein A2Y24_04125 [Clostridiales bacterium GWE2_32_10]|nr:MAG: hypothetical protein A2Y24_04125 [Clostridiales bacterium GWE2_32_10]HBY21694.1 hypothetical protein [Clostridiales bacterium]